jgi:hypothetical protein
VIGFFFFIVLSEKVAQDLVEFPVRLEEAAHDRLDVLAFDRQFHAIRVTYATIAGKTASSTMSFVRRRRP